MDFKDVASLAVSRFEQGYSCSQAVFSSLAEQRGVDRDLALRIAAGLGGGVARTAGTCGCITGGILAIGLAQPSVSPEENKTQKDKTYETGQQFMRKFAEQHGSTNCRDLLGCDISTAEGLQQARQDGLFKTRCSQYVRDSVELVQSILSPAS